MTEPASKKSEGITKTSRYNKVQTTHCHKLYNCIMFIITFCDFHSYVFALKHSALMGQNAEINT